MKRLRLYPYGFILTDNEKVNVPEYYDEIKLMNKLVYSFDSSLKPALYQSNDSFLLIHGHFTHVGKDEIIRNKDLPKVLFKLYREEEHKFLDILDFIGGRYIIIVGNESEVRIYPDASGNRSAYYATNSNLVSSHLYLLADNCSVVADELIKKVPPLKYNLSLTPFSNVKSLLPNLYLDFFTKKTKRFFPRSKNKYTQMSREERFVLVEHLWKQQLDAYSKKYSNLILSLTAGHDSRISLAMARDYKDKIHFFTYTPIIEGKPSNYYEKSLALDRHTVQLILEDIPLKHNFLSFEKGRDDLNNEEKNVLSRNSLISHGRYLLKHYQECFPQEDLIHIRANLLEVGRAYLQNTFKDSNLSNIKQLFLQRVKVKKGNAYYQDVLQLFDEKIHDFHYEEVYGYHLLDLYPWENLHGRWFAEVLNETDVAFDTLLPFNMRAIIDISLSFSLEERKSNFMFDELINRNYPILNFYGKNDERNIYEQIKDNSVINDISLDIPLYFDSIKIHSSTHKQLETLLLNDNSIFIPSKWLSEGNYSETSFVFKKPRGFVNLTLLSSYVSEKNKKYLKYEVLVNDSVVLWEDISDWGFANSIRVFNIHKNDVIKVRVSAIRTCQFKSWEKASVVEVLKYEEEFYDLISNINATVTSPFSNVNKESKNILSNVDRTLSKQYDLLKNKYTYEYLFKNIRLNFYAHIKEHSKKLTIMLPGAVNRSKAIYNFQRHSWSDDIDGSVISFLDPTVSEQNEITIGWFQGNKDIYAIPILIGFIKTILDTNSIKESNVTFLGSSAGGFSCLKLADSFPDSRIIVINPQTRVYNYFTKDYSKVVQWVSPKLTPEQAKDLYYDRFTVDLDIKKRLKPIEYYQNTADLHHVQKHLDPLLNELKKDDYELVNGVNQDFITNKMLKIIYYTDKLSGHSPLSKLETIQILNQH